MRACLLVFGAAIVAATPAAAERSAWQVNGAPDAPPFELTLTIGTSTVSYHFACQRDKVMITERGVTQLMDVQTGQKVGDGPGSHMTTGASVMGLYTDVVDPQLVPAVAVPNSSKGWDLTIELPANDPAFQSLAKAKLISLMTTGWTAGVEISPQDREVIAPFVNRCEAAST